MRVVVPVRVGVTCVLGLTAALSLGSRILAEPMIDIDPCYSHIKTFSVVYFSPSSALSNWMGTHMDAVIGDPGTTASYNPDLLTFNYDLTTVTVNNTSKYNSLVSAAAVAAIDIEDLCLHFSQDTQVRMPTYTGSGVYETRTVPGWNPNWKPGDPPASATSRRQARIPNWTWGSDEFVMSVANPWYRNWSAQWMVNQVVGSRSGVMHDVASADVPLPEIVSGGGIWEYRGMTASQRQTAWRQDLSDMLGTCKTALNNQNQPKYLMANTCGTGDLYAGAIDIMLDEIWISSRQELAWYQQTNSIYGSNMLDYIVRADRAGRTVLVQAWGQYDRTPFSSLGGLSKERDQNYCLAAYYIVKGDNTYFNWFYDNGAIYNVDPRTLWFGTEAVDIGQPVGEYTTVSGRAPNEGGYNYTIWERQFEKGFVLFRPRSWWLGLIDDRSAVTVSLNGLYRVVANNGTLGPWLSQVAVRGNEGVILEGFRQPTVVGDFDYSGLLDLGDYQDLAEAWGARTNDLTFNPWIDMDHDGLIGMSDYTAFAEMWAGPDVLPPAPGQPVPEPVTFLLVGSGCVVLARRWR